MTNNSLGVSGEFQYQAKVWKNGINLVNGLLRINYIQLK